jgi:hypothetical protein
MRIFNIRCDVVLVVIFGAMFAFDSYAWARGLMPRPGATVSIRNEFWRLDS